MIDTPHVIHKGRAAVVTDGPMLSPHGHRVCRIRYMGEELETWVFADELEDSPRRAPREPKEVLRDE